MTCELILVPQIYIGLLLQVMRQSRGLDVGHCMMPKYASLAEILIATMHCYLQGPTRQVLKAFFITAAIVAIVST